MTTATVFPNKYAAHCSTCRTRLEVGQGNCSKVDGKWIVTCIDTETCTAKATIPAAVAVGMVSISLTDVPEGVYSVEGRLYQFDHPQGGDWAGWTFVKHVEMRLTNGKVKKTKLAKAASAKPGSGAKFFGTQAAADLAVIIEDPLAAAKMVGQTTGICGRCSAALTDPVSVERGIGPICWKHWGF